MIKILGPETLAMKMYKINLFMPYELIYRGSIVYFSQGVAN